MTTRRYSLAAAAAIFAFSLAGLWACAPAVSADAPVVTYYYIPG